MTFFRSTTHCLLTDWEVGLAENLKCKEACSAYFLSSHYLLMSLTVHAFGKQYSLVISVVRALKLSLLAPVIPRLFLTAFTFAQPLLVETVLTYLGDENKDSKSVGYGLLVAYGLVYLGIAVSKFAVS